MMNHIAVKFFIHYTSRVARLRRVTAPDALSNHVTATANCLRGAAPPPPPPPPPNYNPRGSSPPWLYGSYAPTPDALSNHVTDTAQKLMCIA